MEKVVYGIIDEMIEMGVFLIKLFISDLDGTLLDENHHLHDHTLQAIIELKASGYYFGVATDRPFFAVKLAWADFREHVDFVICNNGVEIHDFIRKRRKTFHTLSEQSLRQILGIGLKLKLNPILSGKDEYYAQFDDDFTRVGYALSRTRVTHVADKIEKEHAKIVFRGDAPQVNKMIDYINNNPNEFYKAMKSSDTHIEVVDHRVDKLEALKWICEQHEIDLSHIVAVGDGDNDVNMLRAVGVGVAVKNASQLAQEVADFVTDSNIDFGVRNYILKELLGRSIQE